jgi:hypothetical protein
MAPDLSALVQSHWANGLWFQRMGSGTCALCLGARAISATRAAASEM